MKKIYFKPGVREVKLEHRHQMLAGSPTEVTGVNGNVFNSVESDKGYEGVVRSRGFGSWDEE
ncbi:MAG: hypothetical protein ACSW8D_09610 [Prevotella sp.]